MLKYHLQDFSSIGNRGFELTLPERVIEKINDLVKHVGSPNYIRTPVFQKNGKQEGASGNPKKRREKPDHVANTAHWERMKKFQTTKLEEKTGIDLQVNNVRSYLNKLTDKTLSDVVENISNILDEIKESGETETENIRKIGTMLFDIASTNRVFSKVYAETYGILCTKHEVFHELLEEKYTDYINSYSTIEYVSADEDYNAFCKNTKQNDRRRALSAFYLNLYCTGVYPFEKVEYIVSFLLNKIIDLATKANNQVDVDEYTENVAVLYSNDMEYSRTNKLDNGLSIRETIEKYATIKNDRDKYPSISNKCTFRYMDMCGM